MKAIRIHAYGHCDQMALEAVPPVVAEKGQVLVKIHDAGVNPVDWKIREGYMSDGGPATFPLTMGQDLSGEIVDTGEGVSGFAKGESVFGFGRGAYAEYALASPRGLAHKPGPLDDVTAASIPTAGLTAWQIVMDAAKVSPGQKVLIHGAGGGVGSFAVQFALRAGAHVIATASQEDASYLSDLGVEQIIDYKTQRFENEAQDVDVVIDLVGGETLARSYGIVKEGGLLVSALGQANEAEAAKRGLRALNFVMKPEGAELEQIAQLVAQGLVKPRISRVLPLSEAKQADDLSQFGHPHGKVVLQVQ